MPGVRFVIALFRSEKNGRVIEYLVRATIELERAALRNARNRFHLHQAGEIEFPLLTGIWQSA